MKKASITETKNNLSALIAGLKGGSPVLILDRGVPVARLEAVVVGRETPRTESLSRLVRDGMVRPRRAPLPRTLFLRRPPRATGDASALAALLEERREGR